MAKATYPVLKATQTAPRHAGAALHRDQEGAVLIEAAFALTILIMLLMGVVSYGLWFTMANALQQVANEAARASLGALDNAERELRLGHAIENSLLQSSLFQPQDVSVQSRLDGRFYTVTVTYDATDSAIFGGSLIPMPDANIVRSATVDVGGA